MFNWKKYGGGAEEVEMEDGKNKQKKVYLSLAPETPRLLPAAFY